MPSAPIPPRRGAALSAGPARAALAGLAALVAALIVSSAGTALAADTAVTVLLDRAQVMRFPPSTETVVVGNPIIADVTMLKNSGEVILTGRGYGDTNLLFIDGSGRILSEAALRVREPPSMVVVQRGAERETYACQPRCQPTVTLGDNHEFFQGNVKDVKTRNGLASGAAASSGGAPGQ